MSAVPVDLAAYRAGRDEPEPEPEHEIWTLDRHARDPEGSPLFAEIERRLSALERRGRR